MKTNNIKVYINRFFNYQDDYEGASLFSVSSVSSVLNIAIEDDVKQLEMSLNEFKIIRQFMVYSGQWNWDSKTFMGIKFVIKK